jgi:hypothetical protein
MFSVRYELNLLMIFRRILRFKEFRVCNCQTCKANKLRKAFLSLIFDLIIILIILSLLL